MRIDRSLWDKFQSYLFVDRKLSDKSGAVSADKSRFNKIASFFRDKEFNRANFNFFISKLKDQSYSPSYINNLIKMGKYIDEWSKTNELVDYTYFKEARKVNYDILTPQEIEALANVKINYAKNSGYINTRQKALILLLGTTGCRIGEALALKFSDLYKNPPHVVFQDTKNSDDRQVPISDDLFNMLKSIPSNNDQIFNSGRGGRLECQQVNIDLKVRAKKVGINKQVWCHLFRHSFVTTMLEVGVDSLDVAVIVGHRDPRSTLRYKNSLIGHFVNIIHMHPLLQREMPWESSVKNLKQYISKTFHPQNNIVSIREESNQFEVKIIKNVRP